MLTPPSGPPVIETQPSNQTVEAGRTATFAVTASGQLPLSYQWRFYGTNLAGQTGTSLVLANVATNQAGPYEVAVTNASGSVTSAVATLTVVPVLTLGEALDAPQLAWSSGGDAAWTAQTSVTHDGVDAAQSGAISDSHETWVEASVVGPGPLSFWWKVSSESGYDYLEFYTNGVRVTRIAGEVNWQVQSYALGTGTQVLRWRYMKDSSSSRGQDQGWVDQVSFAPPSGPPVIVIQPTNQTAEVGGTGTFMVTAGGSLPLSYQWRFYGTNLAAQTSASLVLTGVTTNRAGPYAVVVTNISGSVTSAVATLTVVPVLTLGEALDAPQLAWGSGGNAPWAGQTSVTHDGVDAAQSGTISHSQETWVETSVVGPGPLSFWWKVSSESGYDYLEFYTDSMRVTRISGEADWQQQSYTLGAGAQVLRWRYMKDGSASSGQDRGWVDQVNFAPLSVRPVILVNDGSFGMSSNRFGFNVTGTAGQVVIVEGSTNLSNWLPLQTNTLGSGPIYFSDPATGAFPWRLYRVGVGP
ncbi:MAG: immunoglobulin domain-containing protein [Verrucomicrobia bacterium]|nr:immunoglobulin domain-containing protein [Verrucomicrobiota bacterium]